PDIVALVQRLIDRGYAYAVDGEVYFRTRKAKHSFWVLSHRKVEDIVVEPMSQAGKKEDPLDFALWKRSKEGEPSWPSAWGPGRPGWHVECNAMAFKYLGAPLDIHGGGLDLVFPHHESEAMICQGAWGVDWSMTWMHNGFLTLEREKMSKSLGNFVTIRDAMDDDLNTLDAVRSLQRMTEGLAAFGGVSAEEGRAIVNVYRECGRVLGLFADLG